jgi:hypothetical protein
MTVESFSLPFLLSAVDDRRDRLQRARWPNDVPGSGSTYGFDRELLVDICDYWRDKFDWKAQLERLSTLNHFRLQAKDSTIHFIHERGWPGSFVEMIKIIPLLTDPAAHGAECRVRCS